MSSEDVSSEAPIVNASILNDSLFLPFETATSESKRLFETVWKDARKLEDEVEVLKWMARRKELEWDCARQMIVKKKNDIKTVKKKINMVRTLNDLGPQMNVDSDDEDTPYEDDDDESSSDEDIKEDDDSPQPPQLPFFVRQPSPKRRKLNGGGSVKKSMIVADFVSADSRFTKGHLCLTCKEKEPLFVCSICNDHWYCSVTCQIDDWPNHQGKCAREKTTSKQQKKTAGLIRFSKDLLKLIELKSKDAKMPVPPIPATYCLSCKKNYPYFLCSECRNHWYCSHKCHEDHWEQHRPLCFTK